MEPDCLSRCFLHSIYVSMPSTQYYDVEKMNSFCEELCAQIQVAPDSERHVRMLCALCPPCETEIIACFNRIHGPASHYLQQPSQQESLNLRRSVLDHMIGSVNMLQTQCMNVSNRKDLSDLHPLMIVTRNSL